MEQLKPVVIKQSERLPEAGRHGGVLAALKKKLEEKREEGWKPHPWKSLPVKNLLVAGCAVLILLAAYLNLRFAGSEGAGEKVPLVGQQAEQASDSDDYFAIAVINRTRAREEALDMYRSLADDQTASEATRQEAYAAMNALVDRSAVEVDIENAVRAKGFENCVAVLEGERANVIVQSAGLSEKQLAQITEIVYLQAGVIPQNLTVTEMV